MNTSAMKWIRRRTGMTAKSMKMTVQVVKQVNGLRMLERLARIPAVALRLTTAIKIRAIYERDSIYVRSL